MTDRDAWFVIDTVRNWLSLLGSTAELEVAMLHLERWVESNPTLQITSELQATEVIAEYFRHYHATADIGQQVVAPGYPRRGADMVIDFGNRRVIIETKFVRSNNARSAVDRAIEQTKEHMRQMDVARGAVFAFVAGESESAIGLERHMKGTILSVAIHVC